MKTNDPKTDADTDFIRHLEDIIRQRLAAADGNSYVAALLRQGRRRVAQKVGEEAVELALASVSGTREEQLEEAADLLFHLLVLLNSNDMRLGDVTSVLENRHRRRTTEA
jgi:phosphoribosyl-ATP pyrophosphohydrolase/phosphoribosyl-AMP cyclohydrolase